jgi:MFS transporter, DHA1 family, inner membrane transport protein
MTAVEAGSGERPPADGRALAPPSGAPIGRQVTVVVLCLSTFLVTGHGVSITPFLVPMAEELGTDLAAVGNLVAVMSVSWGIASLFAGAASDRLGRRPILVTALLLLTASLFGVAWSGTYPWIAAWRAFGGIGGGAFMGTVFATVSDRFPSAERGRALGWIVTGQSLSLVVGVPLITIIGSFGGWRWAMVAQGVAMLVAALAVALAVPRRTAQRSASGAPAPSLLKVLNPRVVALLAAGTMERVCYAGVVVFLATYLLLAYGVSLQVIGVGLALVAIGNLIGNLIGGYLTDRLPARPLLAAASLAGSALLAPPLLVWTPGVELSIALGFLYSLANALGRPALLAALSEVSNEARGALLGLNITFASFGWLGATALGGWLITGSGFGGLAFLTAATGLLGAALATLGWFFGRRPAS